MIKEFFARRAAARQAKYQAALAAMPEPFCGNRPEHYFWVNVQGYGCPVCSGIKASKEAERIRERNNAELAKAIVD
jgi:hypothetical protein